ncbi:hypothetical protein RFI_10191, partial [Reticulomyxa filosa]
MSFQKYHLNVIFFGKNESKTCTLFVFDAFPTIRNLPTDVLVHLAWCFVKKRERKKLRMLSSSSPSSISNNCCTKFVQILWDVYTPQTYLASSRVKRLKKWSQTEAKNRNTSKVSRHYVFAVCCMMVILCIWLFHCYINGTYKSTSGWSMKVSIDEDFENVLNQIKDDQMVVKSGLYRSNGKSAQNRQLQNDENEIEENENENMNVNESGNDNEDTEDNENEIEGDNENESEAEYENNEDEKVESNIETERSDSKAANLSKSKWTVITPGVAGFVESLFTELEDHFIVKENMTLYPILKYDYELFWWTNRRTAITSYDYISIVTQCSIDRLPTLRSMLSRWTGIFLVPLYILKKQKHILPPKKKKGGVNLAVYLFPGQNTNATRTYLRDYFDSLYNEDQWKSQTPEKEMNVALVYLPKDIKWSMYKWLDNNGTQQSFRTLHSSITHKWQYR